ncbi:MAG: 2-oxoacid:acceptor oxidoreductase subunit alpha [Patescibacteria group bacterium]
MAQKIFSWKIGGEAGYGILSACAMFSRLALRAGMYVFDYGEYPSLIRGGHNSFEVTASPDKVYAPRRPISILVALDEETIVQHRHELAADGALIYSSKISKLAPGDIPAGVLAVDIPFEDLAVAAGVGAVGRNVVAIGASCALLNIPFSLLQEIVVLNFSLKKKADSLVQANVAAAKAGYGFVADKIKQPFPYQATVQKNPQRMVMTGNEALLWGAIQAGCKYYAGYPMTPVTALLQGMASQDQKYGIVVKHVEDEISAINSAIGAAYTGVRAMTASSGGGFSLMVEGWGMAAMVEVPLVVVEGMRTGPSTGMPTWTGQDDLKFLLSASQGEFPRFVLAPGDAEQCYLFIQHAFNLAEKYQTPVMVVTDKFLGESHRWVEQSGLVNVPIDRGQVLDAAALQKVAQFRRYEDTASGVSPRVLPGTPGGEHVANSDEHDEQGFTEEGAENRTRMVDKRFRKEAASLEHLPQPVMVGVQRADITLVSWGSTRGPILEALPILAAAGIKANYLQLTTLSPFPIAAVKAAFKQAKKVAIVECNKTGQLAGWLRDQTGLSPDFKILKYDGRPFFTDELVQTIKDLR